MKYAATDGSDEANEYMVKPSDWTCSCMFQTTRLLPCRHIIYYRKSIGCEPLVPVEIVNPRWLIQNYKLLRLDDVEPVDVPYEDKTVSNNGARAAKHQNDKFNELLSFGRQIADVGASWGTAAESELRNFLSGVLDEVRKDRIPELLRGHSETREPDRTVRSLDVSASGRSGIGQYESVCEQVGDEELLDIVELSRREEIAAGCGSFAQLPGRGPLSR
jgi:hypothetical protein